MCTTSYRPSWLSGVLAGRRVAAGSKSVWSGHTGQSGSLVSRTAAWPGYYGGCNSAQSFLLGLDPCKLLASCRASRGRVTASLINCRIAAAPQTCTAVPHTCPGIQDTHMNTPRHTNTHTVTRTHQAYGHTPIHGVTHMDTPKYMDTYTHMPLHAHACKHTYLHSYTPMYTQIHSHAHAYSHVRT